MSYKITELNDGPLKLESDKSIIYKDGVLLETENQVHLCRCGLSNNKPFCDGKHNSVNFSSKREISEEIIQNYKGKSISIIFNRSICAGAGECVRNLPTVFKSESSSEWIYPDNDKNEKIIKTIKDCPSGALSYSIQGRTDLDDSSVAKITIIKNGPYNVESVHLEHLTAPTNFSTRKYSLCRCGHSKNKPYCDYSHSDKKWDDEKTEERI